MIPRMEQGRENNVSGLSVNFFRSPGLPMLMRDLPTLVRDEICEMLDKNGAWKRVAERFFAVKIAHFSVEQLEKEEHPSQMLIRELGQHCQHELRVADFYVTVATLNLTDIMTCLEQYIDDGTKRKVENAMSKINTFTYIHELPYDIRQKLCVVLDTDDSWEELCSRFESVGFDFDTFEFCKNAPSPTNEVLKLLGDRNIKICLLYTALALSNYLKAMSLLENLVSEKLKGDIFCSMKIKCQDEGTARLCNVIPSMEDKSAELLTVDHSNSERVLKKSSMFSFKSLKTEDIIYSSQHISSSKSQDVDNFNEISFKELQTALSEEKCLCQEGGQNIYEGTLKGRRVAIKRLKLKRKNNFEQLVNEIHVLASVKHKNVLKMLNYMEGSDYPLLIYPFKKNGSLFDHLLHHTSESLGQESSCASGTSCCLTWKQRYDISCGIARGLSYLHSCFKCAVILKSSDVLLDDQMNPVLGDICFPCILDENSSEYLAMYLPKRVERNRSNMDTFCLGIILLELAMGIPANTFEKHPEDFLVPCKRNKDWSNIVFDFDKSAGSISKRFEKKWKQVILLCFETIFIDDASNLLETATFIFN